MHGAKNKNTRTMIRKYYNNMHYRKKKKLKLSCVGNKSFNLNMK